MKKIIIQFNEANFDIIKKYAEKYDLKFLKKIIKFKTKIITSSEDEYNHLEPWIQWYSFYTNKKFQEHKVFHLNDYLNIKHVNFLDKLSLNGKKVGVFGSMNLPPNKKFNIYIPDPWSLSSTDKSFSSKNVNYTLKFLVNNNAKLKINFKSLVGLMFLFGFPNYNKIKIIFKILLSFYKKERAKLSAYFDYLFFDYSLRRVKSNKLDFSLIFLNGLAHVQHHYLLNSEFLSTKKNPDWYISKEKDPIYESLLIYDKLFERLFIPKTLLELWVVTGLTQEPEKIPKIYWRFNNHKKIFNYFFKFDFEINPLMTRDFEIKVNDIIYLDQIINFLNQAKIRVFKNNQIHKAFGHINKNSKFSIFSSFIYNDEFSEIELIWNDKILYLNKDDLNFVAIKNSIHNEKGWAFSNCDLVLPQKVKIWDLNNLIIKNYDK